MALTKSDREEINKLFETAISAGRNKEKDKYKQTEKRLYAYQILKQNIERYKLDIEDIKQEDMGKSKDFVTFFKNSGGGFVKPDIEKLREAKIFILKQKIFRDEKANSEIDIALGEIKNDEYYQIIVMKYIEKKKNEEIANCLHCDIRTIGRHKKRLIRDIALRLYGADAL